MNLSLPHVFILTVVPCFHGSEQSPSESLMQCGDLARDLYLELNYIYVRFCNHSIYPSIFLSTYQLASGAGACPS